MDGNVYASDTALADYQGTTTDLFLGKRFDGGQFNGGLDEIRLWNVVRTQQDIQDNRNLSLVGNEPGLVAYWPINENTGTSITDQSTNTHTGIFAGNPGWRTTVLDTDGDGVPNGCDICPCSRYSCKLSSSCRIGDGDCNVEYNCTYYASCGYCNRALCGLSGQLLPRSLLQQWP